MTRDLIEDIEWCKIHKFFREDNIGLANSIINGINLIIEKGYDRFIVIEDDCVPKEGFVEYMLKALEYYEDNDKVMHISGFGLPIKKYTESDVYCTPYPCSWGWGSWAKTWKECDFNQTENYRQLLKNEDLKKKFNYSGEAFSDFLQMQLDGKVNSWLIRWYYHIFMKNGTCIWSYNSYIENMGFDGSGVHRNKLDRFNQKKMSSNFIEVGNLKFENNLTYNENLIREFRRHFMGKKLIEKVKTTIYLLTGIIVGK
ncbi:sugar transferase [Niallia circulans]|uniref:sugar transferase n=1 Tax=Niallia circulans TaxID=1397 RepID=UPI00201DFFEC|nr:sugar transferase [Niallia circulans]